ncbi:MAG: hypothetical protein K9J16_12960 [Melioribacteraceae bacterium]|nr:hypothetical protein [Melioribacteraceae bacterium]
MKKILLIFFLLSTVGIIYGQGRQYDGPDDPAGDPANRREGWMSGNRVFLYFKNSTELSYCCGTQYSKWPNNPDGLPITDGVALLVGARVFVDSENDSIPITNPGRIYAGINLDTLYFLQTSYREETDYNSAGTVEWGFHPVKGYFNINDEYIAMSHIESSWPLEGWPASGDSRKWPGEWNGRFGRGVTYADQETYFVANDAQDQENIFKSPSTPPDERGPVYYPRPGVKIGDKDPDVTQQNGKPWGGLGIRAEVRSFQWNNVQARDNIFFEYNLSNISDYDLPQVAFGYWVDNGIGGNDPYDDLGFFDTYEDMSYSWDIDGIGEGGRRTGVFGFAYLESPGIAYDNRDNDEDGLIDEKRDNDAGAFVGPTDGIADIDAFLKWSGKSIEELKDHWSGDEDQDWQDGDDANGDGVYSADEFYGDDVGLDGVGPKDLNYTGPDEGECNHMPDYMEGIGSEPNFAITDISESDMIGLTTFQLFRIPSHTAPYHNWFRHDFDLWTRLSSDTLMEYTGQTANLVEFFASGIFPLYKGRTERISMSMLHSFDTVEGLNSSEHRAPALFKQKEIVEGIYVTDYRFAQPPEMPTLKAYALDGKVVLSWDDRADKLTHDPFLGNRNDFEGYKLYRSTDMFFSDAELITDGYGTANILKPIFECDLIDEYEGFADWGEVNGQGFYLGDNTGIVHYFVDDNVQNGRTYYYGLTAYDYGIADFGSEGISPSENNLVIDLDEYGSIRDIGRNIQIVIPTVKAAGYVEPQLEILAGSTDMNGTQLNINILGESEYELDKTYKVKFGIDTLGHFQLAEILRHHTDFSYKANELHVYEAGSKDSLIYSETPAEHVLSNIVEVDGIYQFNNLGVETELIDGFNLIIKPDNSPVSVDMENTGWLTGDGSINIIHNESAMRYFPWEYEFVFTGPDEIYTTRTNVYLGILDAEGTSVKREKFLFDYEFNFYVINKTFKDSSGNFEKLDLLAIDDNEDGVFNYADDFFVAGVFATRDEHIRWTTTLFNFDFKDVEAGDMPRPNDVYRFYFKRPFGYNDSLMFRINAFQEVKKEDIKSMMNRIRVVPNPYVAGNTMEPASTIVNFEQKRQIMFTHVPAECEIKIYSASGVLVDEIFVNNSADDGSVHWDLRTRENLEIAAGVYIYHVKANETGDEKIGKFAIIK